MRSLPRWQGKSATKLLSPRSWRLMSTGS